MPTSLDLGTLLKPRRTGPPATPPVAATQTRPNVANASLGGRCEVLRFLSAQDETGGTTEMWTQAGSYPCRVEEAGAGSEGNSEATGVQSVEPYRVYLPKTAQVTADDRLGIPGWFNVWQEDHNYNRGDRVILADFDGYVYECTSSGLNPSPEKLQRWRRAERAQFLEITSVLDAVAGEDVVSVLCKEVS